MKQALIFIFSFIIVYLIYLFTVILKAKKFNVYKVPIEVYYLIQKYKLDMEKINYRRFLNVIALVMAFNSSISITIVSFIKSIILQIFLGLLILIPLTIIVFNLFGAYFKKKGMIKNG